MSFADGDRESVVADSAVVNPQRAISLRSRIIFLAASIVAITVALVSVVSYAAVNRALYSEVDKQLQVKVTEIFLNSRETLDAIALANMVSFFASEVRVSIIFSDDEIYRAPGIEAPIGEPELAVARGDRPYSFRTVDNMRVYAKRTTYGQTLVLGESLQPTNEVLDRLAWVLFTVGGCGVVLAALAGMAVGRTGLRPIARLTAATERVARTDDLTPIPVTGHDELARLTESFNTMLRALEESRDRQKRLVADAGHELRTPLTSLRTNMELLIASSLPGAPQLPEADMAELRSDVLAQIEELSTLVGDLVDLAREDAPETVFERVDLGEVVERALERVRRRRAGIDFVAELQPWFVYGHEPGLQRAVLNVLDNAAKWSPDGERVQVTMRQVADNLLEMTVDDAGPGIPEHERELVFERFYRTTAARGMSGSGLGLAIVRQVVTKHGGTIGIGASDRGGTSIWMVFPGEPGIVEAGTMETADGVSAEPEGSGEA